MDIAQTLNFRKQIKKLNKNQKIILDKAIKKIIEDPFIGIFKKGDLNAVRVYKFHMINQLILIAYKVDNNEKRLLLLDFGTHENFYRDLKGIA